MLFGGASHFTVTVNGDVFLILGLLLMITELTRIESSVLNAVISTSSGASDENDGSMLDTLCIRLVNISR